MLGGPDVRDGEMARGSAGQPCLSCRRTREGHLLKEQQEWTPTPSVPSPLGPLSLYKNIVLTSLISSTKLQEHQALALSIHSREAAPSDGSSFSRSQPIPGDQHTEDLELSRLGRA